MLWAKTSVYAAVTFVLMLAAALRRFFVSNRSSASTTSRPASAPHVAARVLGAALFLTATGVLGLALGALVRNTAGGIATFAGVMFVLPGITAILPNSWGDSISPYLPLNAGYVHHRAPRRPAHADRLARLPALCGYALAALAASAILLVRRDA